MLGEVHEGIGADAWRRTSLAGQLARLSESDAIDVAALIASGRLQDLVSEVELAPRRWARSLDAASKAALEQQAVRRAEALGDDLEDLFETLSADMSEASLAWRRLCHRRDDIESVRVLLREASDLRDLGLRYLICKDTAHTFSLGVHLEHDARRRRPVQ